MNFRLNIFGQTKPGEFLDYIWCSYVSRIIWILNTSASLLIDYPNITVWKAHFVSMYEMWKKITILAVIDSTGKLKKLVTLESVCFTESLHFLF